MFIVVYERAYMKNGVEEERPLAMFRNMLEAKVFIGMMEQNGRRAFARIV